MKKPLYTHDCNSCKFLGSAHYNGRKCDWYHCYEGSSIKGRRTIIARYSSDGPDYSSGTLFCCVELTQLEKKAIALGLELSDDEKEKLLQILLGMSRKGLTRDEDMSLYPSNGDDLLGNSNYYAMYRD